ncbi:O-methyltransferase [Gracilibacillus xinjiangensis]|uniref:tRNA 5-hydroxyuridine methyltransferase n=1 Tax=Gracilibacillus xinjiangensis TaxID=1193282 RepID=A0ABV8X186_9BACI
MIDPNIISYLEKLNQNKETWVKELEEEAEQHAVPVMDKVGIAFLLQMIRIKRPSKILEIGTAIGYSSLRMADTYKETSIVTIERDPEMYERASRNIVKNQKEAQIDVLFGDALQLEEQVSQKAPYDMIFIDAAKGQYQKFFMMYEKMLSQNGIIITDNVLFRGLVANHTETTKRMQKLAQKIDRYNQWLVSHNRYHTTIIPVGDGVAISVPIEHEEVSSKNE